MQIARDRETLAKARARVGQSSISLVPTMGNLHQGHLSLVDAAKAKAEEVWVSLFVNPLQFGEGEDFESYPRTFDSDVAQLESRNVQLLFAPSVSEMYLGGVHAPTRLALPPLAGELCGRHRPGHFEGACTAVLKLFNLVCPDWACFGEKDYQQLTLIKKMVQDLHVPVEVVPVPTVREPDGLAMSSRNSYLDSEQRKTASGLYRQLQAIASELERGSGDFNALEQSALRALEAEGWVTDYIEIRSPSLDAPKQGTDLRVLGAARLGTTRLIDNVTATSPG